MAREIKTHRVTELDNAVSLEAWDDPVPDRGHSKYRLSINKGGHNEEIAKLKFQDRPITTPEDVNGITNEVLLAVVMDRLQNFQAGKLSCRENAIALTHCETALLWLQARTRDRIQRGVEGTSSK